MWDAFPKTAQEAMGWEWVHYQPYLRDLQARDLNAAAVHDWLMDWSQISKLVSEVFSRLSVATNVNTADEQAEQQFNHFIEDIFPNFMQANNALNHKLLASGLEPAGFKIPLRNIRAEAELFREANLPLLTEERKIGTEYDKVVGAETIHWNGEEETVIQAKTHYMDADRSVRERAWHLVAERRLADRDALNAIWRKLLPLRRKMADNADCADYRAFKWRQMGRFDYTPGDCETFHRAIEQEVVPAAKRLYERKRQRLGVDTLRPWDVGIDARGVSGVSVDPLGRAPLKPAQNSAELLEKSSQIFQHVDPQLGHYFDTMRAEKLLDLDNRKNKAPGGYCTTFSMAQRPFIFMNSVGLQNDVQTLLHEAGHSFHAFETFALPYFAQQDVLPTEFCEVASMSMELLGGAYLAASQGGFYSEADAARARVEKLEEMLCFWPYMAVVDSFQHWVYTHVDEAMNPENCDAKWCEMWDRFMPGVDYSGLERYKANGWHHKLHIFQAPLYYVEYGLAQLGAVQVWANSLSDLPGAVASYRKGLALGGTAALPDLFRAAGAQFGFDAALMSGAVRLIEHTIAELDPG